MTDGTDSIRDKVVTLESLQQVSASVTTAFESTRADDESPALMRMERFDQARERLRQESREIGEGLMITVPDREVSMLQTALARDGKKVRDLGDGGGFEVKFGTGLGGGDVFGWIRSVFDWVDRRQAHPLLRPATTKPDPIGNDIRVAIAADWGTGSYGAPKIAAQMKQMGVFDLLMHLGDVYYSGTREEVQERFLDVWPRAAGKISRTLNSNHEMYSGGFGYFEVALPALGQAASYFAFANDHWLLVGLDTAYVDHDMDNQQVAWLNAVIKQAPGRKIVLFSHQQLFSRLDTQGPKLQSALRHLLEQKAISAWYWGHEHQCVIYDAHPLYGVLGRCLGNGGIPEARKKEVLDAPVQTTVGTVTWRRLSATPDSPACLALDGPNPDIPKEQDKFVPHGFMTLEFNGANLVERVFLSDGQELLHNQVA